MYYRRIDVATASTKTINYTNRPNSSATSVGKIAPTADSKLSAHGFSEREMFDAVSIYQSVAGALVA